MNIKLYSCTADPELVDKSSFLTLLNDLDGTLRTPTSVTDPVISVEIPSGIALGWNYAYISAFNRWYFIRDITFTSNKIFTFTMHCDVLYSFRGIVTGATCFVERNQNDFNPLLIDPKCSFESIKEVETEYLNDPTEDAEISSRDVWQTVTTDQNTKTIAVSVFVESSKYTDVVTDLRGRYPNNFPSGIRAVEALHKVFGHYIENGNAAGCQYGQGADRVNPSNVFTYLITENEWRTLQREIPFQAGRESYFLSAVAFPFEYYPNIGMPDYHGDRPLDPFNNYAFAYGEYKMKFYIGDGDISGANLALDPIPCRTGTLSNFVRAFSRDFPAVSDFTECEPYTQTQIFIPYYGLVDVNRSTLSGKTLQLWYQFDLTTGEGTAFLVVVDTVSGATRRRVIFSTAVKVGTQLSLNVTNAKENQNARTASALNTAVGLVSSAVSLGIGAATGNPVAVVGGILGAGKTIVSAVNENVSIIDRATVSLSHGNAGWMGDNRPYIRTVRGVPSTDYASASFAAVYGRPLCETRRLSTLTGFTICNNVHLPQSGMTKPENDELTSIMETGFIL